jgi:hypothetical protein
MLRKVDALKAAIAELEFRINELSADIVLLQEAEMFRLIKSIGDSPAKWESYVQSQKALLKAEIADLEEEIERRRV